MKNKALERLICGLSLSLVSLTLFSFTSPKDTTINAGYKLKTVVVDAGHGRMANATWRGASGDYSQESKVTLAVALKLRDSIQKDIPSVNVVMTRTDDNDVLWQKRADIANENKGQLFISLHCNSLPDKIVRNSRGKRVRVPDHSGKGVLILVYIYRRVGEQEAAIRENEFEDKTEDLYLVELKNNQLQYLQYPILIDLCQKEPFSKVLNFSDIYQIFFQSLKIGDTKSIIDIIRWRNTFIS